MAVDDSYSKVLLHCDGADSGTTFTDEAGNTISVNGNICTKTGVKKFGTASAYCDGSGDYLGTTIANIGTGKFTLDLWVYPTTLGSVDKIFMMIGRYNSGGFGVYFGQDSKLKVYSSGIKIADSVTVSINNWYHIALVGNGGADGSRNIKLYKDGNQVGSTWTTNYNFNGSLVVGTDIGVPTHGLIGYFDEYRCSVGVERWTENFTPPTAAYGESPPPSNEGIFHAIII